MRNLKILQICKYGLSEKGGIEQVTSDYHKIFSDNYHKCISLAFLKRKGNYKQIKGEKGFNSSFSFLGQPISLKYFSYLFRKSGHFDILYLHYPNPIALILTAILKRKKQRLIVHWHSDIIKPFPISLISEIVEKICLPYVDKIVCTSDLYSSSSKSLRNVSKKISIIPIGTEKTSYETKTKLSTRGNLNLIFIGRLVEYKGLNFLIETLEKLDFVNLKIIGDGPLRNQLEAKIKFYQLSDRIEIKEGVEDDLKLELLHQADFLILPSISRSEAFGVVLLESISTATPILTSNVFGSGMNFINDQQVDEKCGYTFNSENQESLEELLIFLKDLDDHIYANLSYNSKKRHENFFSSSVVTSKIQSFIHDY